MSTCVVRCLSYLDNFNIAIQDGSSSGYNNDAYIGQLNRNRQIFFDTNLIFPARLNVFQETNSNDAGTISLKKLRKVLLPSLDLPYQYIENIRNEHCTGANKQKRTMNESFPQQVSEEQADADRSEFVFSNGLSLPRTADQASGENVMPRLNGYSHHREHEPFISQRRGLASSLLVNDLSNVSAVSTTPRYPDYVEYSDRLRTYARWIYRKPDTNSLTGAGFFYTNKGDLVRCYQCGIGLKDFSEDDDPLKEHVKHSSNCLYLKQLLGEAQLTELKRQLQMEDPGYNRQMQWNERHSANHQAYRHPNYQTLEARMLSFTNWPTHMIQTPRQLAEAGLYYTGFEDRVRCFACDGGLQRWDPDDDPWTEHCRWFPACPFARAQKGDEFIALIQNSVSSEIQESQSQSGNSRQLEQRLMSDFEHMALREPEFKAALDEHKDTCLEMGYQLADFNEAVQELGNRGKIKPTIEEVIDAMEVIKVRRQQASVLQARQNETPIEENQRLKDIVICMSCGRNDVNALFLPCTHHRLCMKCAEPLSHCPICNTCIQNKIRTFMS